MRVLLSIASLFSRSQSSTSLRRSQSSSATKKSATTIYVPFNPFIMLDWREKTLTFKSFSEFPSKCCISSMNKFNNRKGEYENRKEFSVAKEIRMARKIDKSKRRE